MVVALLVLDALLSEPINGIGVSHSQKRPSGLHKVGVVLLDGGSGNGILQGKIDDSANDVLEMRQKVIESDEIEFSLDVCVLRQLNVISDK